MVLRKVETENYTGRFSTEGMFIFASVAHRVTAAEFVLFCVCHLKKWVGKHLQTSTQRLKAPDISLTLSTAPSPHA